MKKLYLILLLLSFVFTSIDAEIVINEAMVNEPGGLTSLEWIELYNDSDSMLNLTDFVLIDSPDSFSLPNVSIDPYNYIIICRNLFSSTGSTSFESYWGNNSGVWGDTGFEQQFPEPIELLISLSNQSGLLQLSKSGMIVSNFEWTSAGNDGTSWERKYPDSNIILQSASRTHSTPGIVNSISLVGCDLSIDSVSIRMKNGIPTYYYGLSNRGLTDVTQAELFLYDSSFNTIYDNLSILGIKSDSSIFIMSDLTFLPNTIYQKMSALIQTNPPDDRPENDSLYFMGVGSQYPPLIITEFLANPMNNITSEWIELYNRSDTILDLSDWSIGDALNSHLITDSTFLFYPGEYVVVTESMTDFRLSYPSFDGIVLEPSSWAILNNTTDIVRLVDQYNIEADRFEYESLFDDNYTWGKDGVDPSGNWNRSSNESGTPGKVNQLFIAANETKIHLSNKYVSPDNDGFQDDVSITVKTPAADSYSLKVYDKQGRVVKTFFDDVSLFPSIITWDGLSDNNERLPIGIYIIYLEAKGTSSTKETIVIAR